MSFASLLRDESLSVRWGDRESPLGRGSYRSVSTARETIMDG